jgi:NADH-quinone oxidoreductase subunit G
MVYPDLAEKINLFKKARNLVWVAAFTHQDLKGVTGQLWQIPTKTYFEKDGTFINFQGRAQRIKQGGLLVEQALSLVELAELMAGEAFEEHVREFPRHESKQNHFTAARGQL